MPDGAVTWQPSRLDPAEVALVARLQRRREPATAGGWQVVIAPVPDEDDCEAVHFSLAGGPACLEASPSLTGAILLGLDPVAPSATEEARRLLLELALEDALLALDDALAFGPGVDGQTPIRIGLDIRGGEISGVATLRLSVDAAERLADALDRLKPAPSPMNAVPLRLHIRTGWCELGLAELRTVRQGDVLLPNGGCDATVLVVADERLVWQGRIEQSEAGSSVVVTSPQCTARELDVETWTMSDDMPQPLMDAGLEDLPVRLVFEAGRAEIPFGELGTIGPGHVFPLVGRNGLVDILANGRRIGQGELVQIGETAGVRVLRLSGG